MVSRSYRSRAGNLPVALSSFIGRSHQMSELKALIIETRLVTLTGTGGVGKSRLALELAHELHDVFDDGVWLVDLATIDADRVAAATAASLGLPELLTRWAAPGLAGSLAGHQLLVLDNCERDIDCAAVLVSALLESVPDLHVLVTSRQTLNVPGEAIYSVPPLPAPEYSDRDMSSVAGSDAVTLFLDRGSNVDPEFTLTEHNVAAIARLCARLQGLPLAIELAATKLRMLSVEQLEDRLCDMFRLAEPSSPAVQSRHRSLWMLADWSFDLCSPPERLLWTRLAIFPSGFDIDAIEAVCYGPDAEPIDVLTTVSGLVNKSILVPERHDGVVRYFLFDVLRQYARARLAASEHDTVVARRHRDYYMDLAERMCASWPCQNSGTTWFTVLRREHANLRSALLTATRTLDGRRRGLRMCATLGYYWIASGAHDEGRRRLERFLDADQEPSVDRARALAVRAWLHLLRDDPAPARAMLVDAKRLSEDSGDSRACALVTLGTGLSQLREPDVAAAARTLLRAYADLLQVQEEPAAAFALLQHVVARSCAEASDNANQLRADILRLSGEATPSWALAYAEWEAGVIHCRGREYERANELADSVITTLARSGDVLGAALGLTLSAWCASGLGDHRRATRLLGAIDRFWPSIGGPSSACGGLVLDQQRCRDECGEALGDGRYDTQFESGAALSIDEAVAESHEPLRPSPTKQLMTPLTRREADVAKLIVGGHTNKEIAAALVLSPRTVDTHVENILKKLGFSSRTQIATWLAEQRE